ncbi:MAG: hypothetical protein AAF799_41480 [Myxococcota bacterium]
MTESAILEVRHVRLADEATLSPAPLAEGEEGVFVALAEPPPVRTVLSVVSGDQRRALEVAQVVEVTSRDEHGTRGFYGRWVGEEALERAAKVGTEHLEDGTPVVQPVSRDDNAVIVASDAPVMAVPAPVMNVDDTGVISVGDREDADDVDENAMTVALDSVPGEASESAESEATGEASGDDGSAEATEASEDSPVQAPAEDAEASEDSPVQAQAETAEASEDSPVQAQPEEASAESEPAAAEAAPAKNEGGGRRSRGGRKKRGRRKR